MSQPFAPFAAAQLAGAPMQLPLRTRAFPLAQET
jgi:hypothetical protein